MKKNLKILLAFILGMVLASGVTVYAYSLLASDVKYVKEGETEEITIDQALNELYSKTSSNAQILSKGQVSSGASITVEVDSLILVESFGATSATNTEDLGYTNGDWYGGVGGNIHVFKATGTTVTLSCDRTCGYIVIK